MTGPAVVRPAARKQLELPAPVGRSGRWSEPEPSSGQQPAGTDQSRRGRVTAERSPFGGSIAWALRRTTRKQPELPLAGSGPLRQGRVTAERSPLGRSIAWPLRPAARKQLELPAPVGRGGRAGPEPSSGQQPAGTDQSRRRRVTAERSPFGGSIAWALRRTAHKQPELQPSGSDQSRLDGGVARSRRRDLPASTQEQLDKSATSALPDVRPAAGALRATRGLVLAAASAAIALAGHVLGGGHAPSVPALFVVAGLVGAGFVVLADRRRGFSQILIGALASQPLFHIAFSLAEQHGPADPHSGRPTAEQLAALSQQTTAADLLHGLQAALDPAMVAGHVVAAVGIAWLAAHGESLLWSLFELVARAAAPILQPIPVRTPAPALNAAAVLVTPPRRQQLARVRTRRGPPALRG